MGFQKKLPKIISYRYYKKIYNATFRDYNNFAFNRFDVSNFKETTFHILNKHAPMKQQYLRANEAFFMKKNCIEKL